MVLVPHYPAIYAGKEVVDVYGHIGIELALVEYPHVYDRHDYAYRPKPSDCLILEVEIKQANNCSKYFKCLQYSFGYVLDIRKIETGAS